MDLSLYLSVIYPYLAGEKSRVEFVREYFDYCMENDPNGQINNPLYNLQDDYVNRIFSGAKPLSKKSANIIINLLSKERHSLFFEENSTLDALESLEEDLSQYIPIDKSIDTSDNCFDIVKSILTSISRGDYLKIEPEKINIKNLKDIEVSIVDGQLVFNDSRIAPGEIISVPKDYADQEMVYIKALFDAYSDEYSTRISKENLHTCPQKYLNNFNDQRKNYYSAESVNRFVRDGILDGEDHFDMLVEETYDGLTETIESEYDNGYKRLCETLKQVSQISLNGAILAQIPVLINNKVRKGICHILVNNERFKWVQNNE
ncbi:ABC-three component system protein [Facklamia languida]